MAESYRDRVWEDVLSHLVRPAPQEGPEAIRHFPAGALLETKTLTCEDVLLSGWAGLGEPSSADALIGVLLPGDKLGTILDDNLCCAVALTPVSVMPEEHSSDGPREFRHLIRQCVRACHFSASDRIEDFLLETYERLEAVELASDWTFDLPPSQATLGNILGLSTAHVNRIIKQLQEEARIQIVGRAVTLLKPEAAQTLALHNCLA